MTTPYEERNVVCARCEQRTSNTSQGHYWKYCKGTGSFREFHFCCPDDCELAIPAGPQVSDEDRKQEQ